VQRRAVIAFTALLVGAFFLWLVPKPRPASPQLSVHFLGLTNDTAGKKLAVFELRNAGQGKLRVWLPGSVELKRPHVNGSGSWFTNSPWLKPSSPPMRTVVAAPATEEEWRVRFHFLPPPTLEQRLRAFAASLGLPVQRRDWGTFTAHSEWLAPTVAWDWSDLPKPSASSAK
jgi:hypothetical protein